MAEDLSTPGRSVFPEIARLPAMYAAELEGLTGEQADRKRPDKGWGLWSIREIVSHVASVPYRWLLVRWGPALFGGDLPRDQALADEVSSGRMLDFGRVHETADLLAAVRDAYELTWEVLGTMTLGAMRKHETTNRVPFDAVREPGGESVRAWRVEVTLKAHPNGIWIDPEDPEVFHFNLEYTFRHLLWEGLSHLRSIQMHKQAEGLPVRETIPEVGYIPIVGWD